MNFSNSCDGAYSSLDVRFTKACDNNCSFCIERSGIPALGEASAKDMDMAAKESGLKDVLILGGEPLLQIDKALEFIQRIRGWSSNIWLTTSLPATIYGKMDVMLDILDLLDGLNVSIQSTSWRENNCLLRASNCHNRLELLGILNTQYSHKIRTSINLVQGGIDSLDKLKAAIADLERLGCKSIKINELQHMPDLYVSYEDMAGATLPSPYACGCSTPITMPGVAAKLLLKRSCFVVEPSRRAGLADLCKAVCKRFRRNPGKFAVLYENATLKGGWKHADKASSMAREI